MMELGRIFLVVGVCFLLLGALLCLMPKGTGLFSWFGKLPGDINYKTDTVTVWIPLTSMLIVSLVVSAISWLSQKILR
jgi:hypothetical protein